GGTDSLLLVSRSLLCHSDTYAHPSLLSHAIKNQTMTILKLATSVSKSKAIGVSFVAATATTTVLYSVLQSTATNLRTMKPDWMAAQDDCARFQKKDPMKIN
ncbi:unnamed protein product, partial [Ectocarpus sp. 12 AP-2014]